MEYVSIFKVSRISPSRGADAATVEFLLEKSNSCSRKRIPSDSIQSSPATQVKLPRSNQRHRARRSHRRTTHHHSSENRKSVLYFYQEKEKRKNWKDRIQPDTWIQQRSTVVLHNRKTVQNLENTKQKWFEQYQPVNQYYHCHCLLPLLLPLPLPLLLNSILLHVLNPQAKLAEGKTCVWLISDYVS